MKFLIVKTSSLGDIIQCFPVLEYLKDKFPDCQIDWVVEKSFSDLVKKHPLINRTICINTHAWRQGLFSCTQWRNMRAVRQTLRAYTYDYVFDLQSNMKSGLLTSQARSPNKVGFGWKTAHEWPNVLFLNQKYNPSKEGNIRDDYLSIVQSCFHDSNPYEGQGVQLIVTPEQQTVIQNILNMPYLKQRRKIMVCPGSAWRNKQMSEEALISFLRQTQSYFNGGFLFVWGTQEECALAQKLQKEFPEQSEVVARLPLAMLQNLMNQIDLVIAMDSLPLHLAGTTKVSTFSVFGSSLARKFKPKGSHHHSMQGPCPYGRTFLKRCPILRTCPTGACIRSLSGDEVFAELKLLCK